MSERNWLRALDVGVPGHGIGGVRRAQFAEDADERLAAGDALVAELAHEHVVEEADLVIAGAGGVEAAGRVADLLPEQHLDVRVDVFELGAPLDTAGAEVLKYQRQSRHDSVRVRRGDDVLLAEHARMSDGAGDVVFVEGLVDAGGVLRGERVHVAFEAAAPRALFGGHQAAASRAGRASSSASSSKTKSGTTPSASGADRRHAAAMPTAWAPATSSARELPTMIASFAGHTEIL